MAAVVKIRNIFDNKDEKDEHPTIRVLSGAAIYRRGYEPAVPNLPAMAAQSLWMLQHSLLC